MRGDAPGAVGRLGEFPAGTRSRRNWLPRQRRPGQHDGREVLEDGRSHPQVRSTQTITGQTSAVGRGPAHSSARTSQACSSIAPPTPPSVNHESI
jgi:hypothetical protein